MFLDSNRLEYYDEAHSSRGEARNITIGYVEEIPQDLTAVNINVDNFQEAYDFLISKGFVNPRGDKVTDTSSSRATMLFAPSGFPVNIAQHIRKEEK